MNNTKKKNLFELMHPDLCIKDINIPSRKETIYLDSFDQEGFEKYENNIENCSKKDSCPFILNLNKKPDHCHHEITGEMISLCTKFCIFCNKKRIK